MDVFKWGPAFFSVNEMYFDCYLQCKTSEDMMAAQTQMIALMKQLRDENRNRAIDLPPSSSDEENDGADHDDIGM